jgi:hypothetical protein
VRRALLRAFDKALASSAHNPESPHIDRRKSVFAWIAPRIRKRSVDLVGLDYPPAYGALPATTPMLATVSPFFIEGTAQTYRTTPLAGARASHTSLPNRSVR